jgi:hypothetical protein
MQEFVDSSDLIDDREALVAQLRESGYVWFRGLLPRADVMATRQSVLDALCSVGWASESAPARPVGSAVQEDDYRPGGMALQRLEPVHRLAFHPRLRHVVDNLLPRSFGHPARVIRTVWPHREWPGTGEFIHQDFSVFKVPDMLTSWFPLGDVPMRMGPLRVLAGSHRDGLVGRPWLGEDVMVDSDDPRWSTGDFAAGDVIFFHCLTVHTGTRNTTDEFRLSMDVRWQSADHPVPEVALWPHVDMHFRATPTKATHPDWDEIAAGWSDREPVEVPVGLTVFDHADAAASLKHPTPSRFVG